MTDIPPPSDRFPPTPVTPNVFADPGNPRFPNSPRVTGPNDPTTPWTPLEAEADIATMAPLDPDAPSTVASPLPYRVPDNIEPQSSRTPGYPTGNTRRDDSPYETVNSIYGIAHHMRIPTGLYERGGGQSSGITNVRAPYRDEFELRTAADEWGGQHNSPFGPNGGPGGTGVGLRDTAFHDQYKADFEDSLYSFGGLYAQHGYGQEGGRDDFIDFATTSLGLVGDLEALASDRNNPANLIYALAAGGGGIRGFLNRVRQLSFQNPDLFTQFQMQLMQHGFMGAEPAFGQLDDATVEGISAMLNGHWSNNDNLTFEEYLTKANDSWFDSTFAAMDDELEATDAAAAQELRDLREAMEAIDLEVTLSDPEALKRLINDEAMRRMGRWLDDSEIDSMVADIHDNERAEFWENNPQVKLYNRLLEAWEDANTNIEERRAGVISGDESDVDVFLRALAAQESGGDPTAVNRSGSGAYGTYQFMPETWNRYADLADVNRYDKSPENQYRVARYMASAYFAMTGSWHTVAQMWYAGEGVVDFSEQALNRRQWWNDDPYPSINEYADSVMDRMRGVDPELERQVAGFDQSGVAQAMPTAIRDAIIQSMRSRSESQGDTVSSVSDLDEEMQRGAPGLSSYENTQWDMASFIRNSVNEAAGPDADVFAFANRAQSFYDLLGER